MAPVVLGRHVTGRDELAIHWIFPSKPKPGQPCEAEAMMRVPPTITLRS
jgi:hypothetical protein